MTEIRKLFFTEKRKPSAYYYGSKIDLKNNFYFTYNNNPINLTIQLFPINLSYMINSIDDNNPINTIPIASVSSDSYVILLTKIGDYTLTINFDPVTIQGITYEVVTFTKSFSVQKQIVKILPNNFSIKHKMNVGDKIPIFSKFGSSLISVPSDVFVGNDVNMQLLKDSSLFKSITFCVIINDDSTNLHEKGTYEGSESNPYYTIVSNRVLQYCLSEYDCYCYHFVMKPFLINSVYNVAYIALIRDIVVKTGEQLPNIYNYLKIIDTNGKEITNTSNIITKITITNILSGDLLLDCTNVMPHTIDNIKLVPFLKPSIYNLSIDVNDIANCQGSLIITKYKTTLKSLLNDKYDINTVLNLRQLIILIDESGNSISPMYAMTMEFMYQINGKIHKSQTGIIQITTHGPVCIMAKYPGNNIFEKVEEKFHFMVEYVNANITFKKPIYILYNSDKYNFDMKNELIMNCNENVKFSFERKTEPRQILTNVTLEFKISTNISPITEVITNYTNIRDTMTQIVMKHFGKPVDILNMISKISIVLGIDNYIICYYEDGCKLDSVLVNSEIWFEQLEQKYKGISGLSYDYFLIASSVKNSVLGFTINNIFIPFDTVKYIEIGKVNKYNKLIYLPHDKYTITPILDNSEKYKITYTTAELYLLTSPAQTFLVINGGENIEAIYGTPVNLEDYSIYIQNGDMKINYDSTSFTIITAIDNQDLVEGFNIVEISIKYNVMGYVFSSFITINLSYPTIYINLTSWRNSDIIYNNNKLYGADFCVTFGPVNQMYDELAKSGQLPKFPFINSNLPLSNFEKVIIRPVISIPDYSYADKIIDISQYDILADTSSYHFANVITKLYVKPYSVSVNYRSLYPDNLDYITVDDDMIVVKTVSTPLDDELCNCFFINTGSIVNDFIYNPNGSSFKADILITIKDANNIGFHITDTSDNYVNLYFVKEENELYYYKSDQFIYNIHGKYPSINFDFKNNLIYIKDITIRQYTKFQ